MKATGASGKVMGAIFLRELRSVNTAVRLACAVVASSCVLFPALSHHFRFRPEQVERLLPASCVGGVGCGGVWAFLFTRLKKKHMRNARPCLWRNLCLEQMLLQKHGSAVMIHAKNLRISRLV